jgi:hypothetical protein
LLSLFGGRGDYYNHDSNIGSNDNGGGGAMTMVAKLITHWTSALYL